MSAEEVIKANLSICLEKQVVQHRGARAVILTLFQLPSRFPIAADEVRCAVPVSIEFQLEPTDESQPLGYQSTVARVDLRIVAFGT
jgi:hypothetical protein